MLARLTSNSAHVFLDAKKGRLSKLFELLRRCHGHNQVNDAFLIWVAISNGAKPGPYVTLAETVAVMKQDRKEFEDLLNRALAIDPEKDQSERLVTILMQRKARALLAREDELFLDSGSPAEKPK